MQQMDMTPHPSPTLTQEQKTQTQQQERQPPQQKKPLRSLLKTSLLRQTP